MQKLKRSVSVLFIGVLLACFLVPAIADTGKVNINTDNKEILMTLKHVGEKIAERIIEYRKAHPFKTPEEIMNVKGIGTKVFETNKERIIVN